MGSQAGMKAEHEMGPKGLRAVHICTKFSRWSFPIPENLPQSLIGMVFRNMPPTVLDAVFS